MLAVVLANGTLNALAVEDVVIVDAVATSAVPAVATFKFATRVVDVMTIGAVPIATVLVSCPDIDSVVTLDIAPVTLAEPLKL